MSTPEELVISGLVYPIVKDLALPKIQSIFKKFQITNTNEESVEKQLHDYLIRRYTKFLTIDTLVFPNMQTQLEILYQPLTVSLKKGIFRKNIEIKIDCYPEDLLPNYARVIIEDTAGMGKSTITKKLFQSIIQQKAGIPVLIELSQIKKKNSILKEIQNQMSQIGKKINQDLILKLINEGNFIFLFDGYDEIALDDRNFTIKELHRFIEKAGDNYFLITSRPEDSLASFGDFQKFQINPLQDKEAYQLLEKYDTYGYHKIAEKLIDKLEETGRSLKEYLSNPFLVSLLYKSYEFKRDIPVKKSQFYQQVYDALYESHDLSKDVALTRDKYSNLHSDDFERVLRYIGFFTSKANKIEYDKNSIIQFIEKAKRQTTDLKFKASDYLKDLLKTVPLFKKEGNNYKWAHKSLQDYFAAKFIQIDAKENRIDILKKIFEDEENQRFYNVLLLYCELDKKGFEYTILKWLLIEFQKFVDNNYNDFSKTKKNVKKRIELHFNNTFFLVSLYNPNNFFDEKKGSDPWMLLEEELKNNDEKYNDIEIFSLDFELDFYKFNEDKILLYVLINQKSNILTIMKISKITNKDIFNENLEIESDLINKFSFPKENTLFKINDEKTNFVNFEENFILFNSLIFHSIMISGVSVQLIHDKALMKLKELEKNNPEKEKNELLDW